MVNKTDYSLFLHISHERQVHQELSQAGSGDLVVVAAVWGGSVVVGTVVVSGSVMLLLQWLAAVPLMILKYVEAVTSCRIRGNFHDIFVRLECRCINIERPAVIPAAAWNHFHGTGGTGEFTAL